MSRDITYLGRTNHRRSVRAFGIGAHERLSHTYIVGKTGVGKSTLLEVLALQDALAGRGFCFIDPHGDVATRLATHLPPAAQQRLLYLDAPDGDQPFGYNPLRRVRTDKIPLAVSGLLETLRKLWPDAWGMRMEHVLRNCLYALLELDGSTLPDVLKLLQSAEWRKAVVPRIRNPTVRAYWRHEYEGYSPRLRAEAIMPIQNKLGALLTDPRLHRILVNPPVELRFRSIMDEGGILVVNLSKGEIGEDCAHVLGGLIVSTLGLAAFSRAETAEGARRPFMIYLDEFQNFTTLSLVNMMSELRKYGAGLVLAHQHLHQLEPEIAHAVLGNVGTTISFRVGPEDAHLLALQLQPKFNVDDLLNLPNHRIYLRVMVDGAPSLPFSADTLSASDVVALLGGGRHHRA